MQSKLKGLAAAAVISSTSAIQLETTTSLQAIGTTECHGTYAYQCIKEKVTKAFEHMTGDCEKEAKEFINEVNAFREDTLRETMTLRQEVVQKIADKRNELLEKLQAVIEEEKLEIQEQLDKNQATTGAEGDDESSITLRSFRLAFQEDIKKIYYSDDMTPEEVKAAIKAKVDSFGRVAQGVGAINELQSKDFLAGIEDEFKELIEKSKQELTAFSDYTCMAFEAHVDQKLAEMNMLVEEKQAAMQEKLENLEKKFIETFWKAIEAVYDTVKYHERQGLVWFALYQKDRFISTLDTVKDELTTELAKSQTLFMQEMVDGEKREKEVARQASDMTFMTEYTDLADELQEALDDAEEIIDANNQRLQNQDDLMLQQATAQGEADALEKFVYDLASVHFSHSVYSGEDFKGVQPYGKLVEQRISHSIWNFGKAELTKFEYIAIGERKMTSETVHAEISYLEHDASYLVEKFNNTTNGLIGKLGYTRESIELQLQSAIDGLTESVEETRDADRIALIDIKNGLWKDLSWIIRQALSMGHYHGYASIPGGMFGGGGMGGGSFGGGGMMMGYAQTGRSGSSDNGGNGGSGNGDDMMGSDNGGDNGDSSNGGAKIADIGTFLFSESTNYDPYGFGTSGFGYGPAQTQYRQIKEMLKTMTNAFARFDRVAKSRILAVRASYTATVKQAEAEWETALAEKWEHFLKAVEELSHQWEETVATRTATVNHAIEQAKIKIGKAEVEKLEALDAKEKEIRWAISSLYNKSVQKDLNKALTEAVKNAEAECKRVNDETQALFDYLISKWDAKVEELYKHISYNKKKAEEKCEEAKYHNTALFKQFLMENSGDAFEEWIQKEKRIVEELLAYSKKAWDAILVSYCIKHGNEDDGDVTSVGYGCAWGMGAGSGNAGYRKGVEIEKFMSIMTSDGEKLDVLTYDGEELDIKNIENEQQLIDNAVNFATEGVEEKAKELAESGMTADFMEQQEACYEQSMTYEDALNAQLMESQTKIKEKTEEEKVNMKLRDEQATMQLEEDREMYETHIDEQRIQTLWDIKEHVFELGHTQGYHYGSHDGQHTEIQAQITYKKDAFMAKIEETRQKMVARVVKEMEDFVVAFEDAKKRLDDLSKQEFDELEESITKYNEKFRDAIDPNGELETIKQQLIGEFKEFIKERRHVWRKTAEQEETNAKWQQDSYYRFSLIRLLNAKETAIEEAFHAALAEFTDSVSSREDSNANEQCIADWEAFKQRIREMLLDSSEMYSEDFQSDMEQRLAEMQAFLEEQQEQLETALVDAQAELKKNLKEVYNYNSHDLDASSSAGGPTAAPYSAQQNRIFLTKANYYVKDQVQRNQAYLAGLKEQWDAAIASATQKAQNKSKMHRQQIVEEQEAARKALQQLSAALSQEFTERQELEKDMLEDMRAAAEASVYAKAEQLKHDVIYASHVLKYGGIGFTGFGIGGSSHYGHYAPVGYGSLTYTGIDELDNLGAPTSHHNKYAQVKDDKLDALSDGHDTQLVAMLDQSKKDFDDMIMGEKEMFAQKVQTEIADSAAEANSVKQQYSQAALKRQTDLADLIAKCAHEMEESNSYSKAKLEASTVEKGGALMAGLEEKMDKLSEWYHDRLEWADELEDGYYKEHLKSELEDKLAAGLEALQMQRDKVETYAQQANDELWENVNAEAEDLAAYSASQQTQLNGFIFATQAALNVLADGLHKTFEEDADAIDEEFCDALEQKKTDWAWWLRYFTGYSGYAEEYYEGFDEFEDYEDILGEEGDYDLVFGKYSGPDKEFFDISILDPAKEKPAREAGAQYTFGEVVAKYEDNLYGGFHY